LNTPARKKAKAHEQKKAMPTEWKQYLQVNKYKEETRQGEPTVTEKEKDRIKTQQAIEYINDVFPSYQEYQTQHTGKTERHLNNYPPAFNPNIGVKVRDKNVLNAPTHIQKKTSTARNTH
jgi:hypothetical protein